jgi:hypothetical protein
MAYLFVGRQQIYSKLIFWLACQCIGVMQATRGKLWDGIFICWAPTNIFKIDFLAGLSVHWGDAGHKGKLWDGIFICWVPTNIFKIDFLAGLSVHWGDAGHKGEVVGWHIYLLGPNKYIQNRFFGRLVSALG